MYARHVNEFDKKLFRPSGPLPYTNLIRLVDEIRLWISCKRGYLGPMSASQMIYSTIRRPPIIAKRHMNQPNLEYRVALRGHFPVGAEGTAPTPALQAQ